MLNENRHRLPGTGRAQVDVAAKQGKIPKKTRIPARTCEGCNHRKQKHRCGVAVERGARANQNSPVDERCRDVTGARRSQPSPRRADENGAPTTNQPPADMVYIRRGQDLLLSYKRTARIAGEWRRFGRRCGRCSGRFGRNGLHESRNLKRLEITTRTKAVPRLTVRSDPTAQPRDLDVSQNYDLNCL
jgi:hypothetical protein